MSRLDTEIFSRGLAGSRSSAAAMIRNGQVTVNGAPVSKASSDVGPDDLIEVSRGDVGKYVSRGGLKLEALLDGAGINPAGCLCCDIGSSTGGFTDCLLRRGAERVFAIDSGKGQLHPSLRNDPRVTVMESTNARNLSDSFLPRKADIVTMDVSFISQTLLYPAVQSMLKAGGLFLSLVKPQFEAGREKIGRGGVVRDAAARDAAVENTLAAAAKYGFELICFMISPIKGGDGNIEYLAAFVMRGDKTDAEKGDPNDT